MARSYLRPRLVAWSNQVWCQVEPTSQRYQGVSETVSQRSPWIAELGSSFRNRVELWKLMAEARGADEVVIQW